MSERTSAIAAVIEAHEPNTVGTDGVCTVGCTGCDWTPGSPESFSEHVARIIDTMGELPTCKTLPDGSKVWFLHSKLHRVDGPAIEYADGGKQWYLNGKLHRVDGPAVEWANGSKTWYLNGKLHRTDGPAIERADGSKQWWLDDKRHRTDGPAIEWADGSKQWYLNGKRLTEAEHAKRTA